MPSSLLIRSPVRRAAEPHFPPQAHRPPPLVCCPVLAWTLSPDAADALLSSGLSLHVTSRERLLWSSVLKLPLSCLPLLGNPVYRNLRLPGWLVCGDPPSQESRLSRWLLFPQCPTPRVWETIDVFLDNYQLCRVLKSELCSLCHSVLETLKTFASTAIKDVMKKVT